MNLLPASRPFDHTCDCEAERTHTPNKNSAGHDPKSTNLEGEAGKVSDLRYPAYVFWKNDLTFVMVSDDSEWPHAFEVSDVLWEGLFGWDSGGRRFEVEWDKGGGCPIPMPGSLDAEGFRTAVEFYLKERKGVSYPEPFFGSAMQEVSPAKIVEIVSQIEADSRKGSTS